jgi:hypothetical protein
MSNKYIERKVKVACRGRTMMGEPVLDKPIEVEVTLFRSPGSNMCCCNVECPNNTGGHGQRCKASHPWTEKKGEGVLCPFAFGYPYALKSIGWKMPEELREAVEAVMLGEEE